MTDCKHLQQPGAVLAEKFWGGGIASICPVITESIFFVLPKPKKYELQFI